jgi:outer membrane protein assembly factor BamA
MFRFTLHAHSLAIDGLGIMGLALISVAAARAQSTSIDPSVYEGQTLSAVDLIANPHRDIEPLQSLLAQKSGEPFSEGSVEASIHALEERGGFSNVTAETVSDSSGLRLNFILERPYYIGLIEFPDLDKRFPYAQLLRVVNLPEQAPYSKTRLPAAEVALLTFLHEQGYLNAQVGAAPQIDDANQLVNVTFRTKLGDRAKIRSIQISGLPTDEQRMKLLKALRSIRAKFVGARVKPGNYYSLDREKAAAAFLRNRLAGQGYLSSVVESTRQYDPGKNAVDVMYQADLGQLVNIRVDGARLSILPYVSRRQAKKLVPAYSEGINPEIIQEGERNLAEHFQAKSYFDVRVQTEFRPSLNKTVLVYTIDRGQKHKLQKIMFVGVHQVSEKDLLAQVVVKRARLWSRGRITPKLLTQSADSLRAFYEDRGFESVKITPQVSDRESRIEVTFEIEEGVQSLVGTVRVGGNQHLPENKLTEVAGLQLKAGMPFSQRGLLADRSRILAAYLNLGYPNAEVETSIERPVNDLSHVNVVYAIVERQQLRVSRIAYLGYKRTQLSLVEKATPI